MYKIKKLVWEENTPSKWCKYIFTACDGQKYYRIYKEGDKFWVFHEEDEETMGGDGDWWQQTNTLEEAQAAAQTRFEYLVKQDLDDC